MTMSQFKAWLESGWQSHRASDFNLGALAMSCDEVVAPADPLAELRQKVDEDAQSSDSRVRDIASVIRLIMVTGCRPGVRSVGGRSEAADGLLNLTKFSIIERKPSTDQPVALSLRMLGTDGLEYSVEVRDGRVVSDLLARCSESPTDELFGVTLQDLRSYLLGFHGGALSIGSIRRTVVYRMFCDHLDLISRNRRSPRRITVPEAAGNISKRVGCSVKVLFQSLVDPSVFAL
jgi:hypothetical protein